MKVFIVGRYSLEYQEMFLHRGWETVTSMLGADLVQFIGGADVSPSLYNQHAHINTFSDINRDKYETLIFHAALRNKIPMAGICRGGQFLNIMCGGRMWQHVSKHTQEHLAYCLLKHKKIKVTSTHHQMMIPINNQKAYKLLLVAFLHGFKEKYTALSQGAKKMHFTDIEKDVEALFYPVNRCLCFQPHPEFKGKDKLADLYFNYLEKLFNLKERNK